MNNNELELLDEALDYLNEGKLFNKFKDFISGKKNKKSSSKNTSEPKPMCTVEEYNQYIKKDVDKIFKSYVDATKKALKEFDNADKFIHVKETLDDDSVEEICNYGGTFLYDVDFRAYARINKMDGGEANEYIGTDFIYKFGDAVKKNVKTSVDGVSFHSIAEGLDWDDYLSDITFSREFFNSRIKKENE